MYTRQENIICWKCNTIQWRTCIYCCLNPKFRFRINNWKSHLSVVIQTFGDYVFICSCFCRQYIFIKTWQWNYNQQFRCHCIFRIRQVKTSRPANPCEYAVILHLHEMLRYLLLMEFNIFARPVNVPFVRNYITYEWKRVIINLNKLEKMFYHRFENSLCHNSLFLIEQKLIVYFLLDIREVIIYFVQ